MCVCERVVCARESVVCVCVCERLYLTEMVCDKVVRDAEVAAADGGRRDTEPKAKTPCKDFGKNSDLRAFLHCIFFENGKTLPSCPPNRDPGKLGKTRGSQVPQMQGGGIGPFMSILCPFYVHLHAVQNRNL